MQKIKQIYHPYYIWEEVQHNMWGYVDDVKDALVKAIEFTGDHILYGKYMRKVCEQWKYSCENALTDPHINKKAWIGHAACALALNIPEDIIRKAWGYLTDEQKFLANKEAERAIELWENAYIENNCLYRDVGKQMLLDWYSRQCSR